MAGLRASPGRARASCSRASAATTLVDDALPFLAFRATEVAMLPARVGRISFTGELGYEIWVPADGQLALYDALVAAGEDLGLAPFRRARAAVAAARKELRQLGARVPADLYAGGGGARPLRRPRQGRFHRSRGRGARSAAGAEATPGDAGRRRCRRRCDRRRAGVARRQGRRLDHVGRIWPLRGQVDRAWATCPRRLPSTARHSKSRSSASAARASLEATSALRSAGRADADGLNPISRDRSAQRAAG